MSTTATLDTKQTERLTALINKVWPAPRYTDEEQEKKLEKYNHIWITHITSAPASSPNTTIEGISQDDTPPSAAPTSLVTDNAHDEEATQDDTPPSASDNATFIAPDGKRIIHWDAIRKGVGIPEGFTISVSDDRHIVVEVESHTTKSFNIHKIGECRAVIDNKTDIFLTTEGLRKGLLRASGATDTLFVASPIDNTDTAAIRLSWEDINQAVLPEGFTFQGSLKRIIAVEKNAVSHYIEQLSDTKLLIDKMHEVDITREGLRDGLFKAAGMIAACPTFRPLEYEDFQQTPHIDYINRGILVPRPKAAMKRKEYVHVVYGNSGAGKSAFCCFELPSRLCDEKNPVVVHHTVLDDDTIATFEEIDRILNTAASIKEMDDFVNAVKSYRNKNAVRYAVHSLISTLRARALKRDAAWFDTLESYPEKYKGTIVFVLDELGKCLQLARGITAAQDDIRTDAWVACRTQRLCIVLCGTGTETMNSSKWYSSDVERVIPIEIGAPEKPLIDEAYKHIYLEYGTHRASADLIRYAIDDNRIFQMASSNTRLLFMVASYIHEIHNFTGGPTLGVYEGGVFKYNEWLTARGDSTIAKHINLFIELCTMRYVAVNGLGQLRDFKDLRCFDAALVWALRNPTSAPENTSDAAIATLEDAISDEAPFSSVTASTAMLVLYSCFILFLGGVLSLLLQTNVVMLVAITVIIGLVPLLLRRCITPVWYKHPIAAVPAPTTPPPPTTGPNTNTIIPLPALPDEDCLVSRASRLGLIVLDNEKNKKRQLSPAMALLTGFACDEPWRVVDGAVLEEFTAMWVARLIRAQSGLPVTTEKLSVAVPPPTSDNCPTVATLKSIVQRIRASPCVFVNGYSAPGADVIAVQLKSAAKAGGMMTAHAIKEVYPGNTLLRLTLISNKRTKQGIKSQLQSLGVVEGGNPLGPLVWALLATIAATGDDDDEKTLESIEKALRAKGPVNAGSLSRSLAGKLKKLRIYIDICLVHGSYKTSGDSSVDVLPEKHFPWVCGASRRYRSLSAESFGPLKELVRDTGST